MSGAASLQKDRNFIAVIGDEVSLAIYLIIVYQTLVNFTFNQDSVTGLLLAGIGNVNQQQKRNFLVVDASMYSLAE